MARKQTGLWNALAAFWAVIDKADQDKDVGTTAPTITLIIQRAQIMHFVPIKRA